MWPVRASALGHRSRRWHTQACDDVNPARPVTHCGVEWAWGRLASSVLCLCALGRRRLRWTLQSRRSRFRCWLYCKDAASCLTHVTLPAIGRPLGPVRHRPTPQQFCSYPLLLLGSPGLLTLCRQPLRLHCRSSRAGVDQSSPPVPTVAAARATGCALGLQDSVNPVGVLVTSRSDDSALTGLKTKPRLA